MIRIVAVSLLAVAATAVGFQSQSWAGEDDKTYPGMMCQPANPGERGQIRIERHGAITNVSRNSVVFYCPGIRDAHTGNTSLEWAKITVTDKQSKCRVVIANGAVHTVLTGKLAREGSNWARIFGAGDVNVGGKFSSNSIFFFCCDVNPRGSIISYKFVENNDED